MSAGNATHVVQKLITSYFFAAPTLPSVAELSSDSEIGLYKGGVRVSHISEIPASRIGKKHAYFSLGSSTLEMCVEHTKWEKCELNLGGAVEPSLIVDSPLESNCESVAIKKRGSGSAQWVFNLLSWTTAILQFFNYVLCFSSVHLICIKKWGLSTGDIRWETQREESGVEMGSCVKD
jgi:hypothetical protein